MQRRARSRGKGSGTATVTSTLRFAGAAWLNRVRLKSWPPTLPPAPYLPFLAQTFQQLAQHAFLNPGGGRSVSNCHFLLSFPDTLKIAPSAQCCDRFRFSGRRRTGKEQKTSENDERSKVGH